MSRDLHDKRFGEPSFSHVGVKGVSQIVEHEPALLKSAIVHACFVASSSHGCIDVGDRIYGDGVNITARMEGLAEGGGICISGTVYDAIENKIGSRSPEL
jgi:hypothetical protein